MKPKPEASPPVQRVINGFGLRMVFRAPTMAELTTSKATSQPGEAMKGLVKATLVEPSKLSEIEAASPGYLVPLFGMLSRIWGALDYQYDVLEQDDIEDDSPEAKGWAAAEAKQFEGLFAIRFTPETDDEPMVFVLRRPRAHELEPMINAPRSHEARDVLARKICVFPESSEVSQRFAKFPYASHFLAKEAWAQAGMYEELSMGEA